MYSEYRQENSSDSWCHIGGIEANPEKIKAILNMKPSQSIKEVQSLTGRVVALNKFVSKATNKCLSFFKFLKKAFEWMDEC